MPAARISNTAYQELISTDKLGVIRDRELKLHLSTAMATHNFVAAQLGYFRDAFIHYNGILLPYYRYRFDPRTGDVACSMAWRELSGDPLARTTIASAYTDQRNFTRWRTQEREAVEAVRDRLACLLDKPECPRPPASPPSRLR